MTAPFSIDRIDHFVLYVMDVDKTCAFYENALGMKREDFEARPGDVRSALLFGRNKINLHPFPSPYEPKGVNPVTGAGDFCLITETPIDQVVTHLEKVGVAIEVPPSKRTGAAGELRSIYFRDPDGNLVEVSNYV